MIIVCQEMLRASCFLHCRAVQSYGAHMLAEQRLQVMGFDNKGRFTPKLKYV
jgi:hypothetical protein